MGVRRVAALSLAPPQFELDVDRFVIGALGDPLDGTIQLLDDDVMG